MWVKGAPGISMRDPMFIVNVPEYVSTHNQAYLISKHMSLQTYPTTDI